MNNQPYPAPFPPPAGAAQTSPLAITSLVAGILGWVLMLGAFLIPFCAPLPVGAAIVAVVTGHMARAAVAKSEGRLTGNGLALAGLIIGYVQIVFFIVPICLILVLALLGPAIGGVFSGIVNNL